jgi:general stress protein 26
MNPKLGMQKAGPLVLALAFLATPLQGLQAQAPQPRDTLLAAAREIIESARYCGLVTLDESGNARVRTMDPFAPEADMTIWMGTNRRTRKVRQIENDPRVTLYYFSSDPVGYVTISGRARLVDDPAEKRARFKEGWEAFYADREAEFLLIQVTPERMEVISYSRGIGGDSETWEPPVVEFETGE